MTEPKPRGVDPSTLVIGRRYRVDRKHEKLRRTFRFTGVLLAIETTPGSGPDEPETVSLTFEEKPRFGKPVRQRLDLDTLVAVVPA
ncbi:MAG TPA: hypothetical protein VIE12_04100 [Actinomycetota bacterium]|jgi:hypothetical protein